MFSLRSFNQTSVAAIVLCTVVSLTAATAVAEPLFTVVDGPAGNRTFDGTIGTEFTVGADDVEITALGYEDAGLDGLAAAHDVGIWDVTSGTLLGSVTVQSGTASTLDGAWRYEDLTSTLTLLAGQSYRIGGDFDAGGDAFTDTDATGGGGPTVDFALDPDFTFVGNRFFSGGGINNPTSDGAGTDLRWAPANFQQATAAVPEPGAMAIWLILGSMGGIIAWRTRRFRRVSEA